MPTADSKSHGESVTEHSVSFLLSAFLFRTALSLATFEQVRPFTVQLSDSLFFFSVLFLLFTPKFRVLKSLRSGISLAGALIMAGAVLSLHNASSMHDAAGPLARLFVLFGLFAPLAVIHSKNVRANMFFVLAGISANCAIAMIQAWVFPGIVDVLSINPVEETDFGASIGRFMGLASHPNVLGLSAALGILIGVGLFFKERNALIRRWLILQVGVCSFGGILTGSRTLLASLIPGLLVLALLEKRNRGAVLRGLVALAVIGVIIAYSAPAAVSLYAERVDSSGQDYSPDYGRVMTAGLALLEISQKPIVGWGVDHMGEAGTMLIPETIEIGTAHNTFLQYWYGAGLFGALGFLALFFIPVKQMLRALKKEPSKDSAETLSLGLSSYVLLFIVCNVNPVIYNRFFYVPMFVFAGFATHLLVPIEARKAARAPVVDLPAPSVQATP